MARLNDLPAAAESVESLKRRFIRQNREIARANSIQSLRIRTLESDVSRLLAENVCLREEIIALNQELEKSQSSKQLDNEIDIIKTKLDAKLAEFGSLISDLGSLPQRRELVGEPKHGQNNGGFHVSPEAARRRSPMKMARETANGDEGRLPAILEDKHYPRLTLEKEDIADMMNHEQVEEDSPDQTAMNNPSSSTFETTDTFENHEPSMIIGTIEDETQNCQPLSNLEVRRKRRGSSLLGDTSATPEVQNKQQDFEPIHISKSGSKRKLSVRDDEDSISRSNKQYDDFQFTRLPGSSKYIPAESEAETEGSPTKAPARKPNTQPRKDRTTTRRALGPKTTNLKNRSPTKKQSNTENWEKDAVKPKSKPARTTRDGIEKPMPTVPSGGLKQKDFEPVDINLWPSQQPHAEKNGDIPPKTPAELDISSPFSTEPSGTRQESRDTPPPSLTSSTAWGGTSRPSRRSRGSVSYAEPNLRDKMRRPTKELVDAVPDDHFRRSSKSDIDLVIGRNSDFDMQIGESATFNDGSGSPLGAKTDPSMSQLPSNIMTNRKRRTLSSNKFDVGHESELAPSASSVAISTLIAGSRKRDQNKDNRALDNEIEEGKNTDGTRSSRRHSSAVTTGTRSRRSQSSNLASTQNENEMDIQAVLEAAGLSGDVRASMSGKRSSGHQQSSKLRSAKIVSEFDYDATDVPEAGSEVKRVQRLTASRRRSMML
ncbi:hypothetical protein FQN52_005325 [Onygenales sp. PD_12]|nr:hypothetical protein FQN52_005325 [Onygenales sp. PD_12]